MSAISSWLLSVAGIIILGVLCEMILPDGQMNKYVKVIFSFAVLLVGVVLLIIRLLDVYKDVPYVVYIGSAIGFIVLLLRKKNV